MVHPLTIRGILQNRYNLVFTLEGSEPKLKPMVLSMFLFDHPSRLLFLRLRLFFFP